MNISSLPKDLDWDDLRLCLAVARAGTALGAGMALGLSHTTVLRRISALESRLGLVLFHKRASGYEANENGQTLVSAAERMEGEIGQALAQISGQDRTMRGEIRVALPDITGPGMMEIIRAFCESHPEITVSLEADQRAHTLTRGAAHVAVVLTAAAPPGQMGAPIGPVAFAAYAAKAVLADAAPEDLPWIALDRSLHYTPVGRFERRIAAGRPKTHLAESLTLHQAAIRGGLGVGLLPCSAGDTDERLRRCGPVFCDPSLTAWILHRRELRATARVSAFARHLRQALLPHKDLMAGRQPAEPPVPFPALETISADASAELSGV